MNRKLATIIILAVFISTGLTVYGWGSVGSNSMESVLDDISISQLSASEEEGLLLMREEEKLARDVYLTLYDKWDLGTFTNIAGAESTHMDDMEILLERYNLDDPIKSDAIGVFANPDLQSLYTDLVAKGLSSLENALLVGATIEDLDIYDLERLIGETDNIDIKIVYQNLLKGSRNHMRSFDAQLTKSGIDYDAVYISSADLEKILTTDMERGSVITDPDFRF